MEEVGKVVEDKGNKVVIKVDRDSACEKCDRNCDLAQNHNKDELLVELEKRNIDVQEGQKVILEMAEKNMVFSAIIVYLLPLFFMVGGYFITGWFLLQVGVEPGEVTNIIGSLLFLGISFYIVRKINNFVEKNEDFKPKISRIVEGAE